MKNVLKELRKEIAKLEKTAKEILAQKDNFSKPSFAIIAVDEINALIKKKQHELSLLKQNVFSGRVKPVEGDKVENFAPWVWEKGIKGWLCTLQKRIVLEAGGDGYDVIFHDGVFDEHGPYDTFEEAEQAALDLNEVFLREKL